MIFLFLLSLAIMGFGIYCFISAKQIRVEKFYQNKEIERQKQEKINIEKDINILSNKRDELLLAINKEKQKYNENIEKEKNKLSEQLNIYKENTKYASEQYINEIEQRYNTIEQEYETKNKELESNYEIKNKKLESDYEEKVNNLNNNYMEKVSSLTDDYYDKVAELDEELRNAESRLDELRSSLTAGVQASLREREKEENLQFYKLSVSAIDLEDIIKLNNLKLTLHQPIILSKLIWTQYFQKQTTEMCNRILGTKKICGIYKITNIKTQQCYIGQSVDVAERFKQHVKCGLGIEASATNKLYNSMQVDGVWLFTFELLEECERDLLNSKEAYWIGMYQSDKFGFNSTKGNK